MKRLTHAEWQLLVAEEEQLLRDHLVTIRKHGKSQYKDQLKQIQEIKEGGSSCLGCTLGQSLPH